MRWRDSMRRKPAGSSGLGVCSAANELVQVADMTANRDSRNKSARKLEFQAEQEWRQSMRIHHRANAGQSSWVWVEITTRPGEFGAGVGHFDRTWVQAS